MKGLHEVFKLLNQMEKVRRLGGRDSFFGMMEIFEIILEEEHQKDPNEPKEGMYRFKGMEQYGNIISPECSYSAIKRCIEELKFTKEEFDKLIDWYSGRNSPDTKTLALVIGWCIKDKKYFE